MPANAALQPPEGRFRWSAMQRKLPYNSMPWPSFSARQMPILLPRRPDLDLERRQPARPIASAVDNRPVADFAALDWLAEKRSFIDSLARGRIGNPRP